MADHADPIETGLFDLNAARRRFADICDRDGVRDPEEAAALRLLERGIEPIDHHRRWKRWTSYVERGGDVESKYGRRLAAEAGIAVRPIARQWPLGETEVTRPRPKIIRIRRDGPDAA